MKINTQIFKQSLVKDAFIYTFTDAISKGVSFLLLPVVSFYIRPDELGMATNFAVFAEIITLLAGLAIINAIPYLYYEQTKEENGMMITYLLFFAVCICAIGVLFISFFHDFVFSKLGIDTHIQYLSIPYIICSLLCNVNLIVLRLEDKAKTFAIMSILRVVVNVLMVLLFVVHLKKGGVGKIFADVTVVALMSVFHLYQLKSKGLFVFKFNPQFFRKLVKFGLPLMPHSISSWFKDGMDKVFITSFCGLYQNGLYSMSLTLIQIYKLFSNAFMNAYTPYLQKKLVKITPDNESIEKIKVVRFTYLIWGGLFILSIATVGLSWLIIRFMLDVKYLESFIFIPWLMTGCFISSIYSLTIQFIYKAKKTIGLGIITFTASILQMLIGFFFINKFGAIGAAYSTVIGTTLTSIAIFAYSNKVYKLPWLTPFKKQCVE